MEEPVSRLCPVQCIDHEVVMMPLNRSAPHQDSDQHNRTLSVYASKLAPGADICVGLAILSVVVLSLTGNGLVLIISYRRRKKMVGSELLCVNLAVVDFLSCVLFYPLSILSSFNHGWLGHGPTCVYYGLGCFIFGLCGMFTVAAISVTRYLKTCYSLLYAVWLEGTNVRLVCAATWAVAAVWSCFPLLGWGSYVPEPYGLSCTVAWRAYHASVGDAVYVVASFACFTAVPVLLIAASQWQILRTIYRFSHTLSARGIHNNLRHAEKRLSMMFFFISLGFVVAWAPYTVVSLLSIFQGEEEEEDDGSMMSPGVFVLPALFAKSSHVYNPLIYFYFNRTFQQELRCVLRSLCPGALGNRVSARSTALHHQAPHPIQIELQERRPLGRGAAPPPQNNKSQSSSSSGRAKRLGGSYVPAARGDAVVYQCWGSKLKIPPPSASRQAVREFLPVSM